MPFDAKSATPDTSASLSGFALGADSQSASSPSLYPWSTIKDLFFGGSVTVSSNGRSLIAGAYSDMRGLLGLVVGTDVQAFSSVLQNTTASFTTAQETKLGYLTVTGAVNLDTINTRVNALDAAVVLKGTWDAASGTFPGAGAAQAGDSYIVSGSGTVDGVAFVAYDRILAIADNASATTYAANWLKLDYTDRCFPSPAAPAP